MTKYEWEKELKRHIAALPKSEQTKIFDYYGEIFEDKIEAGMREEDIIYEFGNPFDVAQKILSDYRVEEPETVKAPRFRPEKENTDACSHYTDTISQSETSPAEKASDGKFGRFLLMFFLYLFLAIPVLAVIIALAVVGFSLAVACIAMISGGGVYAVFWLVQLFASNFAASAVVLIGLGLFVAGLGFVFVSPCFKLTKVILVGIGKILRATFNYIRGKKAVRA